MAGPASTPDLPIAGSHHQHSTGIYTSWNGRKRRYTPYTKTPKSRKLKGKHLEKRVSSESQEADDIPLKKFVNKTWYVYQVTPLYRFKQDKASLKRYSRHLSSYLQSEAQKGIGVSGIEDDLGARALFQILPGLVDETGNAEGIEITVSQKENGRNGNKVTLTAILSSVGCRELTEMEGLPNDFERFPVLLAKGLVAPMRQTIVWLESQFDCRIRRMSFNPMLLSWMVAMWTGLYSEPMLKPVELRYTVPATLQGLSYITMTIQQEDACKLWKSIHNGDTEEVLNEEVAEFLQALETHFFHHFKIHLSAMTLNRIATPLAFVGKEGRLKILMTKGVRTVLYHLTELSLENTGLTV